MTNNVGSEGFQPADELTIKSLETLKVFSDPLRQQIIEALAERPKTVKQIASELELVPTKLYYHINLLEEHGIIVVVETRIVSGIIEKHYITAARNFYIERTLLSPGQNTGDQGLDAALASIVERTRGEIRKSIQQGIIDTTESAPVHRKLMAGRGRTRLNKAQAEAFYARLRALMEEFEDLRDEGEGDHQGYSLIFAIYPTSKASLLGDDDATDIPTLLS
jgi:DNA-binding transcriptional ArsR family regulator